jgi:hypothetical protein
LVHEGDLLISSLELDIDIVKEYEGLGGAFVRGTSEGIAWLKQKLKHEAAIDMPSADKYKKLLDRTRAKRDALAKTSTISYRDILECGVEYVRIWHTQAEYHRQFARHRDAVIEGAETAVKGLEVVETSSFAVLDLGAQVYAMGDPIREAAYRLVIAGIHASAKGAGEAVAGNGGERILLSIMDQIAEDAPKILADAFVGSICHTVGFSATGRLKTAVSKLAKALIKSLALLAVDEIYRLPREPAGHRVDAVKRDLQSAGYGLLSEAIAAVVEAIIMPPGLPGPSAALSERARRAGAVIATTVITGLLGDIKKCADKAKSKGSTTSKEFMEDLPWIITRLVTSCAVALSRGSMDAKVEREVKSGSTSVFGKRIYWTESGSKQDGTYTAKPSVKPQKATAKPLTEDDKDTPPPKRTQRVAKTKTKSIRKKSPDLSVMQLALKKGLMDDLQKQIKSGKALNIDDKDTDGGLVILYSGTEKKNGEQAKSKYLEAKAEWEAAAGKTSKRGTLLQEDLKRPVIINETEIGKWISKKMADFEADPEHPTVLPWNGGWEDLWKAASDHLASRASGTVLVYCHNAYDNAVFGTTEWSALSKNPNVQWILSNEPPVSTSEPFGRVTHQRDEFSGREDFYIDVALRSP